MKNSAVIANFNPSLSVKELSSIEDFYKLDKRIENQTKTVEDLDKRIIKRTNELKQRINELGIKINSALFGSKKFINESYAFEIPIKEVYFESNNSAVFKDDILTTKSEIIKNENQVNLNITNITSRKNTDFKFINNNLYIEENAYYNYQEIEVKLPKSMISGFLYIEFDTYNNISVLDSFGKEVSPKKVTNFIKHPISLKNKSIIIRFNNNSKKKIKILEFFVTKENFQLASTIYTKPISIQRSLVQLGLNSCDNYSSEDIDISYNISINNKPFTEIRPLNKQKHLNINSIISTDPDLKLFELTKGIYEENKKLFLIEDFETLSFNLIKSFEKKLGVDYGTVDTSKKVYINIKNDLEINLTKGVYIKVNGVNITGDDNNKYHFKKGIIELEVSLEVWNQRHNLIDNKILKVKDSEVTFEDKNGLINTVIINDSLFYQLYNQEIFENELNSEVIFYNNKIYISKETENKAYVFIKEKSNYVNTVQLKIVLKTTNKNIPPYISSLTVRGI